MFDPRCRRWVVSTELEGGRATAWRGVSLNFPIHLLPKKALNASGMEIKTNKRMEYFKIRWHYFSQILHTRIHTRCVLINNIRIDTESRNEFCGLIMEENRNAIFYRRADTHTRGSVS